MPHATTLAEALAAILDHDMPMRDSLAQFADDLARLNPPLASANETLVQRLRKSNFARNAPRVGEPMPDFALTDQDGRLRFLSDFTRRGRAIITFNRGHWCPFCVIELAKLTQAAGRIGALGADIVSIMPERQAYTRILRERGVPFPVLSDMDCAYALQLGLCFYIGDEIVELFRRIQHHIPLFHGNESWFLPAAATFVVDDAGIVRARNIDPDFRLKRMELDEIIAALRT